MNLSIIEWAETLVNAARVNLEKYGYVAPMCFFLVNGEMQIVPLIIRNEQEKGVAFDYIKTCAKEIKPDAVLTISEAWTKKYKREEDVPEDGRLAHLSDKQECVVFQLSTRNGNKLASLEIETKLPEETKTFGPLVWDEGEFSGRSIVNLGAE